jgi:prepilin-type N-terminal cleavage/methylation domain-containing protein
MLRSTPRRAFTLIELVMVVAILTILAGLTIPIVDWLRRSADKGAASHVMGSLLSNIQLHRATLGSYPNRLDSLIESGGTNLYDGDPASLSGDTGLPSALRAGSAPKLTTYSPDTEAGSIPANLVSSLSKMGINTVMDHLADSGVEKAPGNSGTVARAIVSSGTFATLNSGNAAGLAIINSIYPAGVPAGVRLLVFGFGPANTAVGRIIEGPPSYSGVGDPSTIYDRYLVVVALYTDGKRCQVKAVLDSTGDFLYQEIAEYYDNKPE